MNRMTTFLALIACCIACSAARADYGVQDKGTWPESWPKELEPLRGQARTLEGPLQLLLHYAIPFTKREEFEASWPHLRKVKSEGAPIVLRKAPNFFLGGEHAAGICIHTPPEGEKPLGGKEAKGEWQKTIYLELIVDGEIVDLNRIPLPPDTLIIDERFKDTPRAALPLPAEVPGLIGAALTGGEHSGIAFHYEHGKLLPRELLWDRFHAPGQGAARPGVTLTLVGFVEAPRAMTLKIHHSAGGVNEDHGTLFIGERQLGQVGDDTAKAEVYIVNLPAGVHPVRWVLTGGTFQNSLLRFEEAQTSEPLRVFHDAAQREEAGVAHARELVMANADPAEWLQAVNAAHWRWVPLGSHD